MKYKINLILITVAIIISSCFAATASAAEQDEYDMALEAYCRLLKSCYNAVAAYEDYALFDTGYRNSVALCDVYGDELPELLYITAEYEDVENTNTCCWYLHIASFEDGSTREIYTEEIDKPNFAGGYEDYFLFQTADSKILYEYHRSGDDGGSDVYSRLAKTEDGVLESKELCRLYDPGSGIQSGKEYQYYVGGEEVDYDTYSLYTDNLQAAVESVIMCRYPSEYETNSMRIGEFLSLYGWQDSSLDDQTDQELQEAALSYINLLYENEDLIRAYEQTISSKSICIRDVTGDGIPDLFCVLPYDLQCLFCSVSLFTYDGYELKDISPEEDSAVRKTDSASYSKISFGGLAAANQPGVLYTKIGSDNLYLYHSFGDDWQIKILNEYSYDGESMVLVDSYTQYSYPGDVIDYTLYYDTTYYHFDEEISELAFLEQKENWLSSVDHVLMDREYFSYGTVPENFDNYTAQMLSFKEAIDYLTSYIGNTGDTIEAEVQPSYWLDEAQAYQVYDAWDGLALKSGPGLNYTRYMLIPDGTKVLVRAIQDDWAFVKFNGYTGWMYMGYLIPYQEDKE